MRKIYTYTLIILSLITLWSTKLMAQYDLGFYSMRAVPQTNLLNPAFIPDYKFHFGAPTISSTYTGFGTSGPKYDEILMITPGDSLGLNTNGILNNLESNNNVINRNTNQWLYGGMKWNDFYFSASASDITDVNVLYSDKIIQLALKGNSQFIGETIDLDPLDIKALHYREYALGVAWDVNEKLNIGIKTKALFGKSAIYTENVDLELSTSEKYYNLGIKSNFVINTSLPDFMGDSAINWVEYMQSDANFGLGFDIGATYKLNRLWNLSASILDIGYINYDRYLKTYTSNTEFTYKGIDATQFIGLDDEQIEDKMTEITDSLINLFDITESSEVFRVPLTAKIYLGVDYQFSDKETLGVLFRFEVFKNTVQPSFTASYYRDLGDNFKVSASYTIINHNYLNFGLGIIANFNPLQVYIATDNIIGVISPHTVNYGNIRFGINFIFQKDYKKLPMIEL
ncbi:MAG: hypothetical protein DRI86_07560 [Bacteroidetes bacterium]|nr:MAG: hypothetical protein DRI86_07560 [Bacteroidota bacterium]